MARQTLMEKDVLIEEIAEALAYIGYRTKVDEITIEIESLMKVRKRILSSSPEQIDLEEVRKKVEQLKRPYLNKPKVLLKESFENQKKNQEQI